MDICEYRISSILFMHYAIYGSRVISLLGIFKMSIHKLEVLSLGEHKRRSNECERNHDILLGYKLREFLCSEIIRISLSHECVTKIPHPSLIMLNITMYFTATVSCSLVSNRPFAAKGHMT